MLQYIPTKSLKNKLILYFLLITILPAVAISFFYYRTSQNTLENNMIKTSVNDLFYIGDIIDRQMKFAEQLSDWAFINPTLDKILTKRYRESNYDAEVYKFQDLMDFQLRNTSVGSYVSSFLIIGKNGIDLRVGTEGAQIEKNTIQKTSWFQSGLALRGKIKWFGLVANPAANNNGPYVLPIVRPIVHSDINREIGWQMITFRASIISDLLKNYEVGNDETLMVLDSTGSCIYHNHSAMVGKNLSGLPYFKNIRNKPNYEGYLITKISGKSRVVSYGRSKLTGWTIIKVLSSKELNRQKRLLVRITLVILVLSFIFTSLLVIFLTNHLTHRLNLLLHRTKDIAAGNFERNPSIEGEDELGVLGQGINEMAVNIQNLLEQVIRNEQEKRRLELDVLQNQVNPHFLYNTLNSLKLMATIQKSEGIREMVSALGRLLMNLSRNKSEKITLAEEITLLDDYIYIQNIRYKGKIKQEYVIDPKSCLDYKIIKFSLQPIVENAIFHGIEPKKDAGRILIRIEEDGENLVISIEDDGVGMSRDQIKTILALAPEQSSKRGLSGIGIKNVDERFRLAYGSEYGLKIESVPGEYTRVSFKIPKEL